MSSAVGWVRRNPFWSLAAFACFLMVCVAPVRRAVNGVLFGDPRAQASLAAARPESACSVAATDLVEPEAIQREFTDNEVAANERWKGMCLRVNGPVESVSDGIGGPTLKLGKGVASVRCAGIPAEELARLRKGDMVEVIGRVRGKYWDVQMGDCQTVK